MRLSTKGRYGLKAMFELALHYGEGPIPLKNVADNQRISEHYLEQLIAVLRKNGLVNSVRGAQGGYMLVDSPNKITVGSIIRALEGDIAPSDCVIEDSNVCDRESKCVTKSVWIRIRDSINDVIDSITLQDMVEDYIEMNSDSEYMYFI
ncbi:transcriptional regulator BadM/Rrf2 family [Gottschalkia acidurici 9a]|uniref:Transcriptional regulator BadM/Rrf2 family n=1 Tax=Gottschalkia acidurici (strain ATCC 7906 / DSM 604 / BCRC 14475 / CIP 104303 / KCTC 5404 / NCIMB 10678 / 9a) TaxID=1128398 RepID=K0B048_GOTA9|nr:Rrf2 family transcriptional regulator [Gottschalkia acidurici]AFS78340.1 transcriptional regulator BadM/Rrf2 family [Gottschalkia acidurici 9a]